MKWTGMYLIGYANYKILREENVEIPIDLIWDLFNFTSGLTTGRQIMDRHVIPFLNQK
ncbi:MAG: hypothetical protein WCJ37_08515 [Syntrophus sp. (in: bacteria)]